jgi:hypothetical protein
MWSGFSSGEWLCCSLFTLIAYSSPENLLTCHLIYHLVIDFIEENGKLAEGSDKSVPRIGFWAQGWDKKGFLRP